MPFRIFTLATFAFALSAHAAEETALPDDWKIPAAKENFHIFLLMGQSNMVGYGAIPKNDPYQAGDKDPVPRILMLRGQGTHEKAISDEPVAWKPAAHPLHTGQSTAGFGLGLPFAEEYLKAHPGVTVGLIPCAWGGAGIDALKKETPVFTNAMARLHFAQQSGVIHGVLWHQGESDSVTPDLVDSYEGKLRTLIVDVRAAAREPKLPFVIGNLAEFYGVNSNHANRIKLIKKIRSILHKVATTEPNCAFVPSSGLKDKEGAFVHFDRSSLIEFGQRYAKAFDRIK